MIDFFKKLFSKDRSDSFSMHLPEDESVTFLLMFNDIEVGKLNSEKGKWFFQYSDEFKSKSNEYKPIVGFKDIDKVYSSEYLWPFFRLRIPGLKQPLVKEIIKRERLDTHNEAELLKRFGQKTIANPYSLILV